MAKRFDEIDEPLARFLAAQKLFFVASAPLDADGHVNLSPKGLDTFRILGPRTVAYLDLTGSGVETVAHVRENGRIVLLFCAFDGPPKIMRLHGRGQVIEASDAAFAELAGRFPTHLAIRSVVRVELDRITDSCGYGVPLYQYVGERTQLRQWAEHKGEDGVEQYRAEKNRESIDGLPGIRRQ
ncbi:MAG: hypothetical protein QOD06_2611 [Candidatus Binatota bacterium]|jgi:hypothetical protein|nr:hypothetical protein [Candidatus Binatota bacterium]